jgi:hypothetical protein
MILVKEKVRRMPMAEILKHVSCAGAALLFGEAKDAKRTFVTRLLQFFFSGNL